MYLFDKKYIVSARLSENDYNYLVFLSSWLGISISDVVRSLVTENRLKDLNNDTKTNINN